MGNDGVPHGRQVIDRRLGIPITLSLVYMGVAERVGLDTSGISVARVSTVLR